MNVRLYHKDTSAVVLEKDYSDIRFNDDSGIFENKTELNFALGKASYQEIYFDGVHIGFGDAILSKRISLGFETDVETVEMHFALKGKNCALSNANHRIGFESNQHNVIYANQLCGRMNWDCPEFKLCEINLSPSFFKKFLPENSSLFDCFRNTIEVGKTSLLYAKNLSISHDMHFLINEIMHCNRKGIFKRMFMEAKVIELLMLQLEQLNKPYTGSSFKRNELDKIHAVKDYITQNINNNYSLIELAHLVGTNEFTLKKGFKELFGTTVFGYWSDLKMQQAKVMLLEQGLNVSEVADLSGYKNPRHFSTAFKRKFGVVPGSLKG